MRLMGWMLWLVGLLVVSLAIIGEARKVDFKPQGRDAERRASKGVYSRDSEDDSSIDDYDDQEDDFDPIRSQNRSFAGYERVRLTRVDFGGVSRVPASRPSRQRPVGRRQFMKDDCRELCSATIVTDSGAKWIRFNHCEEMQNDPVEPGSCKMVHPGMTYGSYEFDEHTARTEKSIYEPEDSGCEDDNPELEHVSGCNEGGFCCCTIRKTGPMQYDNKFDSLECDFCDKIQGKYGPGGLPAKWDVCRHIAPNVEILSLKHRERMPYEER